MQVGKKLKKMKPKVLLKLLKNILLLLAQEYMALQKMQQQEVLL